MTNMEDIVVLVLIVVLSAFNFGGIFVSALRERRRRGKAIHELERELFCLDYLLRFMEDGIAEPEQLEIPNDHQGPAYGGPSFL